MKNILFFSGSVVIFQQWLSGGEWSSVSVLFWVLVFLRPLLGVLSFLSTLRAMFSDLITPCEESVSFMCPEARSWFVNKLKEAYDLEEVYSVRYMPFKKLIFGRRGYFQDKRVREAAYAALARLRRR